MARRKRADILVDEHTRAELYDMARDLGVPGRSNMNEAELAEAIVLAGGVVEEGTGDEPDAAPKGPPKSFAISTKETDYLGRLLATPGVEAKDHLGRLTTATVDHLGRLLLDA